MRRATLPLLLLLAGCSAQDEQEANSAGAGMATQVAEGEQADTAAEIDDVSRLPSDEALAGRWLGPEGLVADIVPQGGGRYQVAMTYTLDDSGRFPARRVGDALVVDRPDGPVSLSYGAGAQSGMKWVRPGAHCLIAKVGQEAYCRAPT